MDLRMDMFVDPGCVLLQGDQAAIPRQVGTCYTGSDITWVF